MSNPSPQVPEGEASTSVCRVHHIPFLDYYLKLSVTFKFRFLLINIFPIILCLFQSLLLKIIWANESQSNYPFLKFYVKKCDPSPLQNFFQT